MNAPIPRIRLVAILSFVLAAASCGCTSIRSTLFSYDGCEDCGRVKKHLKGVPTTLAVPTHLLVTVTQVEWGKVDPTTGAVVLMPELKTQDVDIKPVVQPEIFTVDFKRPASGTLSYKLGFDKDRQYITSIENELEDTTIKDVAGLVAAVIKAVPAPARGFVRDATAGNPLVPFPNVVATELFAISEPDLQNRVQAFLAKYVNDCAEKCPPCTFPAPSPKCQSCAAASQP